MAATEGPAFSPKNDDQVFPFSPSGSEPAVMCSLHPEGTSTESFPESPSTRA
jgi:hypothetical protein